MERACLNNEEGMTDGHSTGESMQETVRESMAEYWRESTTDRDIITYRWWRGESTTKR